MVTAGVPQGSVFIYINDPPLGLTTIVKLYADDIVKLFSLFSVVNNASVSASTLNNDLVKIRDWTFNWKMSFNPDPTKQAEEFTFPKKKKIIGTHPSLFFNNSLIEQDTTQKHLGLRLGHKLTFQYNVNEKIKKSHERNWFSSKTAVYFSSNIFTDYLQIVYKTTFGLR